ncbi:MAG: long-chain fatty acid transporter [Pseudomonadota bacterium]|nr:long-chain fatty acid transporter [Pseudomonadota bacterium]
MTIHKLWLAALAVSVSSTSVLAGGFQRGTPDTDILYESGTVNMRTGLTYVNPKRSFESINGVSGDFGEYSQTYDIPSLAFSVGNDMAACAVHYTESFAAEADYRGSPGGALPFQNSATQSGELSDRLVSSNPGTSALSRTRTIGFDSNEFGATCRVSYASDYGRFSFLGGLFVEDFNFQASSLGFRSLNGQLAASGPQGAALAGQLNRFGLQATLPTLVESDIEGGYEAGWRIGAAYEIPEIALRAQVMYRSEVEHDNLTGTANVTVTDSAYVTLNGELTTIPLPAVVTGGVAQAGNAAANLIRNTTFTSTLTDVTSPQYLDVKFQTGIAEGTLLLASFRWTDWSTNNVVVNSLISPVGNTSTYQPYNWRDGYTASIGVGRAFTDAISGVVALGYDRGVSTGAETTYTDLYTLSGGVSVKPNDWAEFRLGGLVGYWTDGSQSISEGSYFNATVGNDMVYAGTASLKFSF